MGQYIDWATVSIVGTIIAGTITGTSAISRRFSSLEKTFYKALSLHKDEDSEKFKALELRMQRVEIKQEFDVA